MIDYLINILTNTVIVKILKQMNSNKIQSTEHLQLNQNVFKTQKL